MTGATGDEDLHAAEIYLRRMVWPGCCWPLPCVRGGACKPTSCAMAAMRKSSGCRRRGTRSGPGSVDQGRACHSGVGIPVKGINVDDPARVTP
jgi:hypothetical protein